MHACHGLGNTGGRLADVHAGAHIGVHAGVSAGVHADVHAQGGGGRGRHATAPCRPACARAMWPCSQ
eukprot:355922-Chlamydomonas_euryale.AAC.7